MKILIIEDEPKTALLLQAIVRERLPDAVFFETCGSIEQAVNFFKTSLILPDLTFMDIHLADGLSFDIWKSVEVNSPVIFCTAHDDYMQEAFQTNAVAYVLKPFKDHEIVASIDKLFKLKRTLSADTIAPYKTNLLIKHREILMPVPLRDFALFSIENEILYGYTFAGQRHPVFKSIEELEEDLDPKLFFRINRQMLVGKEAVAEVKPHEFRKMSIQLKIAHKHSIVVSRLKVRAFLTWLEG